MTDIQRAVFLVALFGVLSASVTVGTVAAQSAPDCSTVGYSGDGTEANPYEVGVVEQLQCIEDQGLSSNYVQVSDIDASGTSVWNDGDGFDPIGDLGTQFTGTFDGAEYTISGLTIDRGSTDDVGLFGAMDFGVRIENVSLNNVNITGNDNVGALVGRKFDGTVERSYATGDVSGNLRVGGLVGFNAGGTIRESYATGEVDGNGDVGGLVGDNSDGATVERSYATGDVSGIRVGGLVGTNDGTVRESYATGDVSGNDDVGGLVGFNDGGTVRESYATGDVSGGGNLGGLVGFDSGGTVTESYWDKQSTGQTTSDGGTGLNTSEMTGSAATSNMVGFDFTGTWETATNPDDYPVLAWQVDTQLFTQPLIDRFSAPPTNIPANDPQGFSDTLYEDLDGDGSGKDVSQTVAVFGELIRGNPLNGDAPDGGLTDEQARALNWNAGSPETEVTPADMVSLFGKQIRA